MIKLISVKSMMDHVFMAVRNIDSQGMSEAGKYISVSILGLADMQIIAQMISEIAYGLPLASYEVESLTQELS